MNDISRQPTNVHDVHERQTTSSMNPTKDKRVIFISGGARGLGAYFAERGLENGDSVYCASRDGTMPQTLTMQQGDLHCGVLNVTSYESCKFAVNDCLKKFGRIDVLINNAANAPTAAAIGQYSPEELATEVNTTLLGSMYLTNAFVALATRTDRQHIVFVSSTSGLAGEPNNGLHAAYAAAKAGVIRFAEVINETIIDHNTSAHVLIPHNIRPDRLEAQDAVSPANVYEAYQQITTTDTFQITVRPPNKPRDK